MTDNGQNQPDMAAQDPGSPLWRFASQFVSLVLIVGLLGGGGWIAYTWMKNPPKAKRRPPRSEATLVEVIALQSADREVVLHTMGTVEPARQIAIAARVSGPLVSVDPRFVPGGYFNAGEALLKIDPADYTLAIEERKGNFVKAESEMKLEMGQQSVARHEYALLGELAEDEDEELLLRQPQLAAKEAAVAIAQAAVDKAALDLERCTVKAPFNAVIEERHVDLGAYVNPGMPLASLVETDAFWIECSVPVDELKWIVFPKGHEDGSEARVYFEQAWGPEAYRQGRVIRLLTSLETEGRMARVLVEVTDPLALDTPGAPGPLLLGSFLRVHIHGRNAEDVLAVPRTSVHNGDTVWAMTEENTLAIRRIETVWSDEDELLVSKGLRSGEKLVTSNLATPVEGMLLRTADMAPPEEAKKGKGPGAPQ